MTKGKKIIDEDCTVIKKKNENKLKKKPGRKPILKTKAKSSANQCGSNEKSDCESTEDVDHGLQILSNSSDHVSITRSDSTTTIDGTSGSDVDWEDDQSKLRKVNLSEVRAKERARQKENADPSSNDYDIKKMHEISQQYAKNYSQNFDFTDQFEYYQERIRDLEEQLKDKNKNSQQPSSLQQPPPNFQQPPPNFQHPPPNFQQPPPNFQQLPPNFQQPFPFHQQSYGFQQNSFSASNQHPYAFPSHYYSQTNAFAHPPLTQPQQSIQTAAEESATEKLDDDLEKRIQAASEMACSDANYSVKLLEIFFKNDELNKPNLNVYGKHFKGSDIDKIALALDEKRVALIKERVMKKVNGDNKLKKTVWTSCVSAMNKKLGQIRAKRR